LYKILSSYWLAHFYLLKNLPKGSTILVWIAGCWNSSNNLHPSCKTIVDFLAFLEYGAEEKIAVCAHTNLDLNKRGGWILFLYEAAQNFEVFSKIQN
jgi:hypothetical protein